ncbi:hypothetical protein KHA80_15940 [Anaerobacillus sp. HL2]|nr:hypothetical protein KHA80_15940 [Anaerobacillus sp. HL2]
MKTTVTHEPERKKSELTSKARTIPSPIYAFFDKPPSKTKDTEELMMHRKYIIIIT